MTLLIMLLNKTAEADGTHLKTLFNDVIEHALEK